MTIQLELSQIKIRMKDLWRNRLTECLQCLYSPALSLPSILSAIIYSSDSCGIAKGSISESGPSSKHSLDGIQQ